MDPFSSKFNAKETLTKFVVPDGDSELFESVDDLEQHLIQTNVELVEELRGLESQKEAAKNLPMGSAREASLARLCAKKGRSVTEPAVEPYKLDKHASDDSEIIARSGPLDRLEEYVKMQSRVCIILRGRNTANSFITGIIVSCDKHWNLLVRDAVECFKPSVRMKRRTSRCMHYKPHPYHESHYKDWKGKTKTILQRQLPFSFIRGDDVVLIKYSSQTAQ
ncbi:unnamed protein product [Thelazia callipaeda]|uniref:Sm domain-containing protein n=1 Tax=Thelazia callipaeda TaxID=103827 RepID=A0A0N5D583_THECL|nr:unnamed protein product [Thelazia callipaeda]